jgi:hypothetical protein
VNIDPLKTQVPTTLGGVSRRGASTGGNAGAATGEEVVSEGIEIKENLVREAGSMPDVRADVVEMGRRLAADPNYPPDELVEKFASMLVDSGPGLLGEIEDSE